MFTEADKQVLLDHAGTIESGLARVAEAFPRYDSDNSELAEAIRYAGERIEHGLVLLTIAIEKHLPD